MRNEEPASRISYATNNDYGAFAALVRRVLIAGLPVMVRIPRTLDLRF